MPQDLKFIVTNAFAPLGRVSSTARRGRDWFDRVAIGDIVNLVVADTGDCFGRAAVVEKELVALADVLANADHNAAARNPKYVGPAKHRVAFELKMAYGPALQADDEFTILHLLPLNEPAIEDIPDEVEAKIERTQTLCDACDVGMVVGAESVTVTEVLGDAAVSTTIKFDLSPRFEVTTSL